MSEKKIASLPSIRCEEKTLSDLKLIAELKETTETNLARIYISRGIAAEKQAYLSLHSIFGGREQEIKAELAASGDALRFTDEELL